MPVMFDSVEPTALPASGFDATAGYVNGRYPSSAAIKQRFPKLPHVAITVTAKGDARCLDVEPGDATVDEVPAWLDRQYTLGNELPIVYTGAGTVQALRDACGSRRYLLWSAHWNYKSHICGPDSCQYPQADATQWSDPVTGGPNVDQTLMSNRFFLAIGGTVASTLTADDKAWIAAAITDRLKSFFVQGAPNGEGFDRIIQASNASLGQSLPALLAKNAPATPEAIAKAVNEDAARRLAE